MTFIIGNKDQCRMRSTYYSSTSWWPLTFYWTRSFCKSSEQSRHRNLMLLMSCYWIWMWIEFFALSITGADAEFLVQLRLHEWYNIYIGCCCTASNWISGTRPYGKHFSLHFNLFQTPNFPPVVRKTHVPTSWSEASKLLWQCCFCVNFGQISNWNALKPI